MSDRQEDRPKPVRIPAQGLVISIWTRREGVVSEAAMVDPEQLSADVVS
jgi:hypothetical protein